MPLLLKACTGLSNRQIEHVQEESTLIAKACDRFRDLGIDLAVISAFETLPTKISGGIRGKREIVINSEEFKLLSVSQVDCESASRPCDCRDWPKGRTSG